MILLFFFLLIFSLFSLIIGLIKPSPFTKIFKRKLNRKQLTAIFGTAFIIFFFGFVFSAEDTSNPENAIKQNKKDIINTVASNISNPEHSENNIVDKDNKLKDWPVFDVESDSPTSQRKPTLVWVEKVINDHEIVISYISHVSDRTFTNLAYVEMSYDIMGKLKNDCEIREATNEIARRIEHSMVYLSIQQEPYITIEFNQEDRDPTKQDRGDYKAIIPDDIMYGDFLMLSNQLGKNGFARLGTLPGWSGFTEREQAAAELSKLGFWGICGE